MGIGSLGTLAGTGLGIFQGLSGSKAASQGAGQGAAGSLMSALLQQQMFQQAQQNLAPFMKLGQGAYETLAPLIGIGGNPLQAELTSRFQPTMEQLAQTPGYQFTLDQGLRAVQNAAAAKGLGSSSTALRNAADYASGLASNTYQQQFQNYWNQNQSIYNMLAGLGNTGLQAAGAGANLTGQMAGGIGNALQGYGQMQGAGTIGSNNALWSGLNSAYGLNYAAAGSSPNSWFNKPLMNFFGNPLSALHLGGGVA